MVELPGGAGDGGSDNRVSSNGGIFRIRPQRGQVHRRHYVRVRVQVRRHEDGGKAVFHSHRELVRYNRRGGVSGWAEAAA